MMTTVMIVEAVRVAEREALSAHSDARQVFVVERTRGEGRIVAFRRGTSSLLHRFADALEPRCDVPSPVITNGSTYGCM